MEIASTRPPTPPCDCQISEEAIYFGAFSIGGAPTGAALFHIGNGAGNEIGGPVGVWKDDVPPLLPWSINGPFGSSFCDAWLIPPGLAHVAYSFRRRSNLSSAPTRSFDGVIPSLPAFGVERPETFSTCVECFGVPDAESLPVSGRNTGDDCLSVGDRDLIPFGDSREA